MKTEKVKINGQVELEIEEGMSVSEKNGVVKVSSLETRLNDLMNGLIANMAENAWTKWRPKVGEVVKAGLVGRYIMFIYSGVGSDGYPMGFENLYLSKDGTVRVGGDRMCATEEMVPTTSEDRTRFFLALNEQGWKYNSKKKELKRVARFTPKRGDFIVSNKGEIAIVEEAGRWDVSVRLAATLSQMGVLCVYNCSVTAYWTDSFISRPANWVEVDRMHTALKEAGLRWNSKAEKVEKVEKWTPKNGDFVAHTDKYGDTLISIFKEFRPDGTFETHAGVGDSQWMGLLIDYWSLAEWADRPATESEIKIMNDALEKAGKRWNAELKRIEDVKPEYKEGDFITRYDGAISIYKNKVNGKYFDHAYWGGRSIVINANAFANGSTTIRLSTEEEKRKMISELYKVGKVWNVSKNRIENIKAAPVEMTMEQVCEKLGMNVKIVKK